MRLYSKTKIKYLVLLIIILTLSYMILNMDLKTLPGMGQLNAALDMMTPAHINAAKGDFEKNGANICNCSTRSRFQISKSFLISLTLSIKKCTRLTDLVPSKNFHLNDGICKKVTNFFSTRWPNLTLDSPVKSFCSDEATLLGPNQKVISYSLYQERGKTSTRFSSRYFPGILINLEGRKEFYPDWIIRIYHNLNSIDKLCQIVCKDQHTFLCDVRQLPGIGDVEKMNPKMWRFLPVGDPTVEKFIVRDIDSQLSQRERVAVKEWEESHYPLHGMRDYHGHNKKIMGGMWGADNRKLGVHLAGSIHQGFLAKRWQTLTYLFRTTNKHDQFALEKIIYDPHKDLIMTHDSYKCLVFNDSVPFSTKREGMEYVGKIFRTGLDLEYGCPEACRPSYGKDWLYC